jgi:hypothetical protein
VFLGYSNQQKGFKCLDLSTGRTYISRDVIFYENIFPFSKLRPNSGPQLRVEISPLLSSLVPSSGGESVFSHMSNAPNPVEDCENMQNQ